MARYLFSQYHISKPADSVPWNANLSTAVNAVVNEVMQQDGVDPGGPERYNYFRTICERALHLFEPEPARPCVIWDLFNDHNQSLLFPMEPKIQVGKLETLVLLAQVYLGKPDVVGKIRSMILDRGPRKLSTFRKSIKGPELHRKAPLFGSFLEAAIRTHNHNLAVLLVRYEVDITEITKARGTAKEKKKRQYDWHFLEIATAVGDEEMVQILLETRPKPASQLWPMIRLAVCAEFPDVARVLMDYLRKHGFPGMKGKREEDLWAWDIDPHDEDEHPRSKWHTSNAALMEACRHGNLECVRVMLDSPYNLIHPAFLQKWWARGLTWNGVSPVDIAIGRGDEAMLRLLIARGANPYGLDQCKTARHGTVLGFTDRRLAKSMVPAAEMANVGIARVLVEAGWECCVHLWMVVLHKAMLARVTLADTLDRVSPEKREGTMREWRRKDVQFWQYLVHVGAVDLTAVLKGCDSARDTASLGITKVGPVRSFILDEFPPQEKAPSDVIQSYEGERDG